MQKNLHFTNARISALFGYVHYSARRNNNDKPGNYKKFNSYLCGAIGGGLSYFVLDGTLKMYYSCQYFSLKPFALAVAGHIPFSMYYCDDHPIEEALGVGIIVGIASVLFHDKCLIEFAFRRRMENGGRELANVADAFIQAVGLG